MQDTVRAWLDECRGKLSKGAMCGGDLDRLEALLDQQRQLVLYLYGKSTNMRSPLASWALFDATQAQEPVLPMSEPPYDSVLAAVGDGWRVVQFPIAKLYNYQGQENDYLGFEFVLEKMV